MEVYERLIRENEADPAQIVISGMWLPTPLELIAADTVVIYPPEKDTREGGDAQGETSEILEKPLNREEQVSFCEVRRC